MILINKEYRIRLYVILLASVLIVALLILAIINDIRLNKCYEKEKSLHSYISFVENNYNNSQVTIDQLNEKLTEAERVLQSVPRPPRLKIANTDDPITYIKRGLMKRKDLIPYEGVLGGTMQFIENGIHVLNYRWVYAYFEDGHIGGEMILGYGVSKDGKINWKVIESCLD